MLKPPQHGSWVSLAPSSAPFPVWSWGCVSPRILDLFLNNNNHNTRQSQNILVSPDTVVITKQFGLIINLVVFTLVCTFLIGFWWVLGCCTLLSLKLQDTEIQIVGRLSRRPPYQFVMLEPGLRWKVPLPGQRSGDLLLLQFLTLDDPLRPSVPVLDSARTSCSLSAKITCFELFGGRARSPTSRKLGRTVKMIVIHWILSTNIKTRPN